MVNGRETNQLPTIETEEWQFETTEPTPISIDQARKLLADAYADIPCEIEEAGTHGYAWIVETKEQWLQREGITNEVTVPTKPRKGNYDFNLRLEFAEAMERYELYNHLMQQGKRKLLEWFGEAVFNDLCVYGVIPVTTTPKKLLAHLVASIEDDDPDLRDVPSNSRLYISTSPPDSSGRNKSSKRVSVYANLNLDKAPDVQLRLFSPPRQRQKWGSDQVLPHVNWADLFFDLFYVAAFYNLGNILVDDPSLLGILYFSGGFFSILSFWAQKLIFDAQFSTGDDIFHKVFEIAVLVVLATNVSSIATVTRMSNPSQYVDMFGFALSRTILCVLHIARYLECLCVGRGQRKNVIYVAKTHIQWQLLPLCLYTAATIISGLAYFGNRSEADAYYSDSNYEVESSEKTYDDKNSSKSYGGGYSIYTVDENYGDAGGRALVGGDYETSDCDYSNTTHLPIILLLAAYLCYQLAVFVMVTLLYQTRITIPMNIDFIIHRNGELIMLVLGESILSLLIVDGDDGNYHKTFYFGIVTVIVLMVLHFQSQPHDANSHAMRRSKNAGVLYQQTYQIYCAVLVAVGASYKIFMYSISKDKTRRLLSHMTQMAAEEIDTRWLAGVGGSSCGPYGEEKKEMTAHLFSWSMALVFICMDVMQFAHVGLEKNIENCKLYDDGGKDTHERKGKRKWRLNFKALFFVVLPRGGITIFVLTLGFWEHDPSILPALGFAAVLGQLVSRFLGKISFPQYELNSHHHGHGHHDGISDDDDDDCEEEETTARYSQTFEP